MCGPDKDSDIIFGSVSHLGSTWLTYTFRLLTMQCKWTFTKHFPLSTRPVASFQGLGGRIYFRGQDFLNYMFRKVLLEKTQFGDAQKHLGWRRPRMPPRGYIPAFYTTKTPLVTATATKMRLVGSNSQVSQDRAYYLQIFKEARFFQRSTVLLLKKP